MTLNYGVNPIETLPAFELRDEVVQRDVLESLLGKYRAGEAIDLDTAIREHPGIRRHRSLVLDLVYEDYCTKTQRGTAPGIEAYARTLPEYSADIENLLEVHRYFQSLAFSDAPFKSTIAWPNVGDVFLGFRLIAELGRGVSGERIWPRNCR
ncbi:MAG: hypothetical protein QM811_08485 [Pirellulales bacterium]